MEFEEREAMGPKWYADVYKATDHYSRGYATSPYMPLWAKVVLWLRRINAGKERERSNLPWMRPNILEVGCGTGQLGHYLWDAGFHDYRGFDFCSEAVSMAQYACPGQPFFVGDATDKKSFNGKYNTAILIEVLEHVKDDLAVLGNVRSGAVVIMSLPMQDDPSHMRLFNNSNDIMERYGEAVDLKGMVLLGWNFLSMGIKK